MMTTYTSGDFERALADWDADPRGYRGTIEAALAIAALVTREGVIEGLLIAQIGFTHPDQFADGRKQEAAAIRRALTEPAP